MKIQIDRVVLFNLTRVIGKYPSMLINSINHRYYSPQINQSYKNMAKAAKSWATSKHRIQNAPLLVKVQFPPMQLSLTYIRAYRFTDFQTHTAVCAKGAHII